MKKKLAITTGVLATAVAALVYVQRDSGLRPTEEPSESIPANRPQVEGRATLAGGAEIATFSSADMDMPLTEDQIARVDAYLELERTREALREYFDDPEGQADNAQAIYETIDRLEREGRVIGFEAMHMKLSWLALNTPDEATYEERATELMEDYAAKDRAAREAFKPESIPGFTDYKTREAEIIAEVNRMDSFPQGQTRQQYLRERLLEARIEAYGEGGEQSPPR